MEKRSHIRMSRPRLKVAKDWKWRVIVINSEGFIDWDDYAYPEHALLGTQRCIDRLKEVHAQARA